MSWIRPSEMPAHHARRFVTKRETLKASHPRLYFWVVLVVFIMASAAFFMIAGGPKSHKGE